MKFKVLAATTLAAVTVATAPVDAAVLYSQPTTNLGANASQSDPGSLNATVYDNFTLADNATLGNIGWVGSYFNPPSHGALTSFTLTFYSDNAGEPGSSFAVATLAAGQVNETAIGTDAFGNPEYTYSAPFNVFLPGGVQLWFSVVANMAFPPQWGWEVGSGGDSSARQDFQGANLTPVGSDFAFILNGTFDDVVAIPEPGSLASLGMLLGFGALGVQWCRRWPAQPGKAAS